MIRSMTAFANHRTDFDLGTVTMEMRSVNNRYLDLHLRLPEELRFSEASVREQINRALKRGKVELRMNFQRAFHSKSYQLNPALLQQLATQLADARAVIPDVPAPRLSEVMALNQQEQGLDHTQWQPIIVECLEKTLADLNAAKQREGERLAQVMLEVAQNMHTLIDTVEQHLPALLTEQQEKITIRLTEALSNVSPEGFALISGEELSARIAQESSLFSLRIDVAEEITRLRSHIEELTHILSTDAPTSGSTGKRLDFLFQEMNREANTLGSKAGSIEVTNTAIELKLLIEQLREQAQNIE